MKNTKSFTIVELLVVMAVIGILITLAVVGIQALQQSQRETVRMNDLRNLNALLATYYGKYRQYPTVINIVFDSFGTKQGICLISPLDSSDGDFECIDSADSKYNMKVEFGSLGLYPWGFLDDASYSYSAMTPSDNHCSYVAADLGMPIGADHWAVVYNANFGTPQQYKLFGCLESGYTINFGTMD